MIKKRQGQRRGLLGPAVQRRRWEEAPRSDLRTTPARSLWQRSHLCSECAGPGPRGSEVLLEKVQQGDLIVLAGLRAANAVSLVGVDLGGQRRQAGGTGVPPASEAPPPSGSARLPSHWGTG